MDERRERVAALLGALSDDQIRLVEDYARSLRDLDAAREAYHALEELWKSRPDHAGPLGQPAP
jgi:hypothetical protein